MEFNINRPETQQNLGEPKTQHNDERLYYLKEEKGYSLVVLGKDDYENSEK